MDQQIKDVLATVLRIDATQINEDTTTESVESWDSLQHINLIVAIEEEFDVQFEDGEIINMTSFSAIKEAVAAKQGS